MPRSQSPTGLAVPSQGALQKPRLGTAIICIYIFCPPLLRVQVLEGRDQGFLSSAPTPRIQLSQSWHSVPGCVVQHPPDPDAAHQGTVPSLIQVVQATLQWYLTY